MKAFLEARQEILDRIHPLAPKRAPLELARGRYLAEDLAAKCDLPRFDQSAMDGYGVRVADVAEAGAGAPVRLVLKGAVFAGGQGRVRVGAGSAARVLTGARVPPGAEAVVMQEYCSVDEDGHLLVKRPVVEGENIRRQGEEWAKGDKALSAGTRFGPAAIGLAAAFGFTTVRVHRRPTVGVIATGDEIVAPGEHLRVGQIYDSNSPALAAALGEMGIEDVRGERVPDDPKLMRKRLAAGLADRDLLLVSGGVSVGDRDYVRELLDELGVRTVFWGVAMKPGKPFYFGLAPRRGKARPAVVFGLPGNPLSALVTLHQLGKPGLLKMMGDREPTPVRLVAKAGADIRGRSGRLEWVMASLCQEAGEVVAMPVTRQGSHMLGGLAGADCLIEIGAEQPGVKAGEPVQVEMLSWRG